MVLAEQAVDVAIIGNIAGSGGQAEVERLVQRLERGFIVIDEARASGRDVREWEDVWIQMLARYEALVERLVA